MFAEPVGIDGNVAVEQSGIGPDVSIDDGAGTRKSIIENSTIGRD